MESACTEVHNLGYTSVVFLSFFLCLSRSLCRIFRPLYFISFVSSIYAHSHFPNIHTENHRTESSFMDSLIFKIFPFQFVNSYTSLFYIAFFKNGVNIWGSDQIHDQCNLGMNKVMMIVALKLAVVVDVGDDNYACCSVLFYFCSASLITLFSLYTIGEVHPDIISAGCMSEVTVQLVIILGTNIVVGQTREFLIPYVVVSLSIVCVWILVVHICVV